MAFPLPLLLPTVAEAAADREREYDRDHPDRDTLELAAAGAAKVLGPDHSTTRAFAKASNKLPRPRTAPEVGYPDWSDRPPASDR